MCMQIYVCVYMCGCIYTHILHAQRLFKLHLLYRLETKAHIVIGIYNSEMYTGIKLGRDP